MNPNKIRKLRHQAFIRQSGRCCYCMLPIWEGDPAEFTARYCISLRKVKYLRCTAEHLVAQKDGGCDTAQNIAAACSWCNRMRHLKRHDKAPSPEKYKNHVTQLITKRRWHPAIESNTQAFDVGSSMPPAGADTSGAYSVGLVL